jgi:hypothetical protein
MKHAIDYSSDESIFVFRPTAKHHSFACGEPALFIASNAGSWLVGLYGEIQVQASITCIQLWLR